MSWAEIKKSVNSDLQTPLNELFINSFKLFPSETEIIESFKTTNNEKQITRKMNIGGSLYIHFSSTATPKYEVYLNEEKVAEFQAITSQHYFNYIIQFQKNDVIKLVSSASDTTIEIRGYTGISPAIFVLD